MSQPHAPTEGFEVHTQSGQDVLELMVVDARTLFVYWEIGNRKRWLCSQHFGCDYGALPKVLRVYDVTCVHFHGNNANCHFDVTTTQEACSWYIPNVSPNTSYAVDIGIYSWEHQFIPLLRSQTVITPRDYPAQVGEPLLPVYPEANDGRNRMGRIMPRFHENFHIYEEFAKRGAYPL